jgi:hypothetical protein
MHQSAQLSMVNSSLTEYRPSGSKRIKMLIISVDHLHLPFFTFYSLDNRGRLSCSSGFFLIDLPCLVYFLLVWDSLSQLLSTSLV